MSKFSRLVAGFICAIALCAPVCAQNLISQLLPSTTSSSSSKTSTDPLGRETPYGTIFGFLQAAQAGDYGIAAQYLQMSAARRQSEGQQLATKLKVVLDNAFTGRFKN